MKYNGQQAELDKMHEKACYLNWIESFSSTKQTSHILPQEEDRFTGRFARWTTHGMQRR